MQGERKTQYEFYAAHFARFGSALAAEVRREAYGRDLGQLGWRSLAEQDAIVALADRAEARRLLDIACGSGGPSLAIVAQTGCTLMGVDIEPNGIQEARQRALAMGLDDRADFLVGDCGGALPLADGAFDVVLCIDAIIHLDDRGAALREWFRLLSAGGVLFMTDAAVLTGPVSKPEIDIRASQGPFAMVPPGVNERLIEAAGFRLLERTDTTRELAEIASRLHDARQTRAAALQAEEGTEWFAKRQRFLSTTASLAAEGRLSRLRYLAEKPLP